MQWNEYNKLMSEIRMSSHRKLERMTRADLTEREVLALWDHAQEVEELADKLTDDFYLAADKSWGKAMRAAEKFGGAQFMERLAVEYGHITPCQKEYLDGLEN